MDAAPYIRREFDVKSMCLFGSMARGDNSSGSDADVCVDMPPKAFRVLALKSFLQDLLGMSVDLIRRNPHMSKFLINEIERDGLYIFDKKLAVAEILEQHHI